MTKIGYARVSSKEQNLDRQLQVLEGVSKVFSDKVSGATTERPQLQAKVLNFLPVLKTHVLNLLRQTIKCLIKSFRKYVSVLNMYLALLKIQCMVLVYVLLDLIELF